MNDPQLHLTAGHDPEQLIDAYMDESLTADQGEALNTWVKLDPANARRFVKATWLHRQVYDRLHVRDLQHLSDEAADHAQAQGGQDVDDSGMILAQLLKLEENAGDSGIVDLTEELKRRDLERKRRDADALAAMRRSSHPADTQTVRVLVVPKLLVYGSIAAVVLGLLSVAYVAGWGNRPAVNETVVENPPAQAVPEVVPEFVPEIAPQVVVLPPVVAELVQGDGLVWGDPALSTRPGTELRKGTLAIDAGIARVRFQSGAVATFRGPAVIELRGDNRMALTQGAMVANVPEQAYGFTVDTPTMRVVDLGTEFGVTAEETGDSAVQVFVGEVTAAAFSEAGRPGRAISLTSRTGVAVDAQTRMGRAIEVDGRAFEDLAPHVGLLHRNLVINGDFEQGEPGTVTGEKFNQTQNVSVVGWEDAGPGTILRYDEAAVHNYPDPTAHVVPDGRGQQYYLGMAQGLIRQRIDVADLAAQIDADAVGFDLSAWLGGFEGNDEYIQVSLGFLDSRGRPIAAPLMLDTVRAADRQDISGFLQRSTDGRVPAGTRSIVIELDNIGDSNPPYVRDGYADNIELVLSAD